MEIWVSVNFLSFFGIKKTRFSLVRVVGNFCFSALLPLVFQYLVIWSDLRPSVTAKHTENQDILPNLPNFTSQNSMKRY